jgi:HPt (histidine-containing phosphotransfer) domain-containing protein
MTAPAGFIDFFVLEAGEYVEQLDALMLRAASDGPDGDAMQRTARALRGAATMAKLPAFADLASALEGVGRATRDGGVVWDAGIRGAVIAAIDDLKILVRGARTWGDAESQRASARARELTAFAPTLRPPSAAPAPRPDAFLVGEANAIAGGLELVATRPDDRDAAANVLARIRALRGVAGVKDVPRLADVVEAAENAARALELGQPRLSPERVDLLRTAAGLLQRIAVALRDGMATDARSEEYDRFLAVADSLDDSSDAAARTVPIASLFFDDAGPHVMTTAANPPTTPEQRFRLEMVSLGEHFRRLVSVARGTSDSAARERLRRDLRRSLRTIQEAAESFGEQGIGDLIAAHAGAIGVLDRSWPGALEGLARALANPGANASELEAKLSALRTGTASLESIGAALSTPPGGTPTVSGVSGAIVGTRQPLNRPLYTPSTAPTPIVNPAVPPSLAAPHPSTPILTAAAHSAAEAASSLDEGIARFESFAGKPFAQPSAVEEQLVPIQALVYRGQAAVRRAIEVRERIRAAGTPPTPDALNELFDLLDLALAE